MYEGFKNQMKNGHLILSEGLIKTYPIDKSVNIIVIKSDLSENYPASNSQLNRSGSEASDRASVLYSNPKVAMRNWVFMADSKYS